MSSCSWDSTDNEIKVKLERKCFLDQIKKIFNNFKKSSDDNTKPIKKLRF